MTTPEPIGGRLLDSDYESLYKSWLDKVTIDTALLRRVDSQLGAETVGQKAHGADFAGVVFPYLWPGADPNFAATGIQSRHIRAYRLRRDRPEIRLEAGGGKKEVGKYMAAPGSGNHLYFHPATPPEWLTDDELPIVIVEGEKKTLALWRLAHYELPEGVETARFLPLGLSGVFNWRGKVGKQPAPDGGSQVVKGPLPELERLAWHDRKVTILFDANVRTNDMVKQARAELARHLYYDRHARVHFAELPKPGGEESWNGIDDFLAAKGPERTLKLIDGARERKLPPLAEDAAAAEEKEDRLARVLEPCEWIQTPNNQLYVSVAFDEHRETMGIRSRQFGSWLARRLRAVDGKAPNIQAVNEARAFAESEADAAPAVTPVHLRVAGAGDVLYLDLASAQWETIAIDREGYRLVTGEPPVRFRRARTMGAQCMPMAGGSLDVLRTLCNCEADENFILLCAWLVGALAPTGPYPVLQIRGEQGSAKSTTSKIARLLVDPAGRRENFYSGAIKSMPKDERDLMISAANSWVMIFDNTSGIPAPMSDCLCRLSTGGAFSTRQLHSDDEEMVFEAMRPLILNGIDDMATMPDLLDRALTLDLPAISESRRRAETQFWAEFDAQRPKIVGALYAAVAAALKHGPHIKLERAPRMADFARWVCGACEGGALPFKAEAFLDAYFGNRADSVAQALEASPLALQVQRLARDIGHWEGTASQLLDDLNSRLEGRTGEVIKNSKSWPKDVRAVGNRVRRIAPLLRQSGLEVETDKRVGHERTRVMVFRVPAKNAGGGENDVRICPQGEFVV